MFPFEKQAKKDLQDFLFIHERNNRFVGKIQ